MILLGSSERGFVAGDDDPVGQPLGGLAHGGALAAVAVAARAEHHREGAVGDIPGRPQHRGETLGRVGEVDYHREVLAGVHRLEPSRNLGRAGQAGRHRVRVHAEHHCDLGGEHRVGPVEGAPHRQRDGSAPPAEHAGAGVGVQHLHVALVDLDDGDLRGGHLREAAAPLAGDVHHRPFGQRAGEEPRLGREVVLDRAVVVEVVAAQIGEGGGPEPASVHPVLGQAVRRDLDRGRVRAAVGRLGQGPLQVAGLGGGQRAGEGADLDSVSPRASHEARDQPHRRGLAVGSRDADDVQAAGRMPVDGGRGRTHGPSHRLDHQARDGWIDRPLGQHGRRPRGHGVGREAVPVEGLARNAGEQRAGPNPPAVVLHVADAHLRGGVRRTRYGREQVGPQLLGQFPDAGHVGVPSSDASSLSSSGGTTSTGSGAGSARLRCPGTESCSAGIRSWRSAYSAILLTAGAASRPARDAIALGLVYHHQNHQGGTVVVADDAGEGGGVVAADQLVALVDALVSDVAGLPRRSRLAGHREALHHRLAAPCPRPPPR